MQRSALRLAGTIGTIAVAGGSMVLLGWLFDLRVLTRPVAVAASMKPNTAVAIVLAGVSLRLLVNGTHTWLAAAIGFCLSLLGLATLGQDVSGWDLGIDQLLFADTNPASTSAPGRMAPATAFCFIALGLALSTAARRAPVWLTQAPAVAVMLVAAAASVGHTYGVNALYGIGPYTTMAVHTAPLLFVVALGVLCSQPDRGVMAPAFSAEMEGTMTRRFLLAGTAVPLILGFVVLTGERAGVYGAEFSAALMAIGTIIVLSIVIWANAGSLERLRTGSAAALRTANETLEYQVARQTKTLAQREKEFRLVVEEAHESFVAMDARGRIVEVNGRTEDMFGWPRADLIGHMVSERLIPARHREAHHQGLRRFAESGEGPVLDREIEIEAVRHDGREFPVALTISAVWLDDEWRFNAFIRDLTETRAAAQQLENTVRDREALLVEVHHRVKDNLQVISSFLRLQSRAIQDSAVIDALRQNEERVKSMALLHEHAYSPDHPGRVDFGQHLRRLAAALLQTYTANDGRITITSEVDLPLLEVDKAVPLNLLVNELMASALTRACADGRTGRISVQISRRSEMAVLSFKDDGIGFAGLQGRPAGSTGLEIIEGLSQQLGGRGHFRQDGGTEFTLEFRPA
ncbi:MAG: PAS domain S-box protein [Acidobacteria bacterium]|nr:PAS domain S-box protein [Acidobacteriota bacterium]